MRTVLRRALGLTTAGALAAGGLLITTAPASATNAAACEQTCIVADDISGTPEGAVFTFHTTALTRAQVRITDLNGSNPVTLQPDTTWGSYYELTADDNGRFHQGNVYKYAIYATDTQGFTESYSGEFVTLYRTTTIHYDNLKMIHDGDNIGPGDFVGDGRCNETGDWKPLSPMIDDALTAEFHPELYAELNDGDSLSLSATYDCPTPGPRVIEAETALEDDDDVNFNPEAFFWHATSPYEPANWDIPNWDEAYTTQMITDPLDPTATGSADVAIGTTSPFKDPNGNEVAVWSEK